MKNKNKNLDDLIGTSSGQPIIVQDSGGDKKFLYILIILLVILFIIAIAVIAFLGSKYFSSNNSEKVENVAQVATQQAQNATTKTEAMVNKAVENTKKVIANQADNQEQQEDVNDNTLSELENLVKEEESKKPIVKKEEPKKVTKAATKEEKVIQKVATAAGGKNLSQEDLAKIAKLVAQELAKSKSSTQKAVAVSKSSSDKDLVSSLEGAETDTLKTKNVNTTELKDTQVNKSAKKVDTFNKVIIKKKENAGDDELAKLSSEIDSILKSEEVSKKEKSLKYGKELKQEIARRERELRYIVVKSGDTLGSLAYKAYGRASAYTKIYEANPDLVKNPNRIYVGMKLRVPVDEEFIKQQGN